MCIWTFRVFYVVIKVKFGKKLRHIFYQKTVFPLFVLDNDHSMNVDLPSEKIEKDIFVNVWEIFYRSLDKFSWSEIQWAIFTVFTTNYDQKILFVLFEVDTHII